MSLDKYKMSTLADKHAEQEEAAAKEVKKEAKKETKKDEKKEVKRSSYYNNKKYKMKEYTNLALAAAVVLMAVAVYTQDATEVVVRSIDGEKVVVMPGNDVGAVAGPDYYNNFRVHGGFQQGGGVNSIDPVDATYTLTAANMENYNVITHPASTTQPALTLTLPASTTFPLSAKAGSYRTWIVENPFTQAPTTTTIAAGTGVDLQEPDGQNVVIGINNYAYVTCFREASSDVVCKVDEVIPAD